jgi:hypothetical protein
MPEKSNPFPGGRKGVSETGEVHLGRFLVKTIQQKVLEVNTPVGVFSGYKEAGQAS